MTKGWIREVAAVASDAIVVLGAVVGTFWMTYAGVHGVDSSVSLRGIHVSFVHELLLGAALTLVGLMRGVRVAQRSRHDRGELAGARLAIVESVKKEAIVRQRLEGILAAQFTLIAKSAGIGSDDRVSYFIDDTAGGGLRLAYRYSLRQTHRHVDMNRLYSYDSGCLGEAWDSGEPIYENFCDPADDLERWKAQLETKWRISPSESETIVLRARTLFARRIDSTDVVARRLGVVVVESAMLPRGGDSPISETRLRGHFGQHAELLAELLKLAIDLRPPPIHAGPSSRSSGRITRLWRRVES